MPYCCYDGAINLLMHIENCIISMTKQKQWRKTNE